MSKDPNAPDPERFPLAAAIHARSRKTYAFDVAELFGLGGKDVGKMQIRVPTKQDEESALVGAHARVEKMSKQAGSENAMHDSDVLGDAKAMGIIQKACLREDGKVEAFPGTEWMRKHWAGDQVGVVLNLVNEVKARESSIHWDLSLEKVDAIMDLCVRASSTDIPERVLAGYQREYLTSLVAFLSITLWNERRKAAGRPDVGVERLPDGTYAYTFADGDEAEFEPLEEGSLGDLADSESAPDDDEKA